MKIETYNTYIEILKSELKPAMGCTEPIAIALASAKCREILGKTPQKITATCSGNIIKNVKAVLVPNSNGQKGVECLRDHARPLQPPAVGAERNRPAHGQPSDRLPPRHAAAEGHPLPGDDRNQTHPLDVRLHARAPESQRRHPRRPEIRLPLHGRRREPARARRRSLPRSLQAGRHGRTARPVPPDA